MNYEIHPACCVSAVDGGCCCLNTSQTYQSESLLLKNRWAGVAHTSGAFCRLYIFLRRPATQSADCVLPKNWRPGVQPAPLPPHVWIKIRGRHTERREREREQGVWNNVRLKLEGLEIRSNTDIHSRSLCIFVYKGVISLSLKGGAFIGILTLMSVSSTRHMEWPAVSHD